jgi:MFS family permease
MSAESASITKAQAGQIPSPDRRQRWLVLATLSVVMFLVIGSTAMTIPIFMTPLIKHYGWSHARVSTLPTVYLLMLSLGAPITGWLLDRLDARIVMSAGAAIAAVGLIGASQSHSYGPMIGAYVLLGAGAAGSTLVPCAVVAANWFADNRGLALGATLSGSGAGGMLLPPVTDYLIRNFGIGLAYLALALPIIFIVLPMVLLLIRTRPAGAGKLSVSEEIESLPGLDLGPALRSAPFWLLSGILMLGAVGLNATFYHMVPYLINAGYAPAHAALVQSAMTAVGVPANLLLGSIVDRFSARKVLPWALLVFASGMLLMLGAAGSGLWIFFVIGFVLFLGSTASTLNAVTPVALVETLGLRRFATISGLTGLAASIGSCAGAMVVGWIVDLTASYSLAFELGAACVFLGAIAALAVSPAEGVEAIPASALPLSH